MSYSNVTSNHAHICLIMPNCMCRAHSSKTLPRMHCCRAAKLSKSKDTEEGIPSSTLTVVSILLCLLIHV